MRNQPYTMRKNDYFIINEIGYNKMDKREGRSDKIH